MARRKLLKSQVRLFEEANVAACVMLVGGQEFLEVGENGKLAIPKGVKPTGFHLTVASPEASRSVVLQKNVGETLGAYHATALSEVDLAEGFRAVVMHDPITVMRAGPNVWTSWHQEKPNRIDIWSVDPNGRVMLFQVGVFTHNNGESWYLAGDKRWLGQFCNSGGRIVAKPDSGYSGFETWRTILQQPAFVALVESATIPDWTGSDADLNPPLPKVASDQLAVDWFILFAGQTGQGIAKDQNGKPVWVHGVDVEGFDPNSTEPLLRRGDIVSYQKAVAWGNKPGAPPKAIGVKLVKRVG